MNIQLVPKGYTQLEYIEQPLGNSGYIKTGIDTSNTLDWEITAQSSDNITDATYSYGCFFGGRIASKNSDLQLTTYKVNTVSTFGGTFRVGSTNEYNAHLPNKEKFTAKLEGTTYTIDDTPVTNLNRNLTVAREIYIFALNNNNSPTQYGHYKLYSLKFTSNGILLRNFIPCKDSEDVVGLYDTVSKSFFTSENNVVFTAGPVKTITLTGIAEKLVEVQHIKDDLRDAINSYYPSEELTYSDGLVEYPDAIDGITVTSNLPTEPKDVNFIDYDGTLLYAYTAQEFRASEGLPHNPFHSGLVAQGWNWTREEILDYLNRAERIDVGQMYITSDGATRYYIHKDNPDYLNQTLILYQGKANGVLVNWGDGTTQRRNGTGTALLTHQYATTGDYVISLLPDDDCPFQLNERADSYTTYTYNDNTVFGKYYTTASVFLLMQECYKVELGKGLAGISACAFRYFGNLKTISIPKNITTFGAGCFYLCFSLQCIVFPRNTERNIIIRDNSCRALRNAKYLCTSTTWSTAFCGSNGFQGNLQVKYILVPDVCTSYGSTSFQNSRRLEYFYMSKNITSIGGNSFQGCTNLKRLNMPSLTTIPDAFRTCTSLQYLKFQEGTTTIANSAFYDLHSVYEIDLPSTITTIGSSAFLNCYNVRRIIVRATTPPTLTNVNAFQGAYVTNSGASYRSTGTGMAHFYVPYSADHSVLQAYLDSDATSSWGYYLTFDCAITELNADGTIPEEDWV